MSLSPKFRRGTLAWRVLAGDRRPGQYLPATQTASRRREVAPIGQPFLRPWCGKSSAMWDVVAGASKEFGFRSRSREQFIDLLEALLHTRFHT